jgi:hypothetical protein
VGTDGHLWSLGSDGSRRVWNDYGTPPSTGIDAVVGAMGYAGIPTQPYVSILGSDGNLWMHMLIQGNSTWVNWGIPGPRIRSGVGMAELTGSPYAFVIADDGHLWANLLTEFPDAYWYDLGTPP